jgi:hypothetical protein
MAVYYWCPDADRPYGGVRAIYRHVDILNEHGVAAFVLHERRPFRCTWFRNGTRIAYRTLSARHPIPAAYERALRGAKRIAGGDPGGTIELGPDDVLWFRKRWSSRR